MLPILRTISVGGVLLAITILGLALIPPSRTNPQLAGADLPARGALIDRLSHPEWRQFLILSALRRAEELGRLRDLPGAPSGQADIPNSDLPHETAAPAEPQSKVAGLPAARREAGPEDETGSINAAPSATIPIDIGETSSFELPVSPVEETPPVARLPQVGATTNDSVSTGTPGDAVEPPQSKVAALSPPEKAKPVVVIRKRNVRRAGSKTPAAAPRAEVAAPPPFNLIQAFFANLSGKQNSTAAQPTDAVKPAAARRPRINPKQTAGIR